MKSLITGLLLLSSLSIFASTVPLNIAIMKSGSSQSAGQVTEVQSKLIKKAIAEQLLKAEINCGRDINKSLLISNVNDSVVSVSEDLLQPIIVSIFKFGNKQQILNFTTSPDFKKILQLDAEIVEILTEEVNVGTLLNPIFETQTTTKSHGKTVCTVKI